MRKKPRSKKIVVVINRDCNLAFCNRKTRLKSRDQKKRGKNQRSGRQIEISKTSFFFQTICRDRNKAKSSLQQAPQKNNWGHRSNSQHGRGIRFRAYININPQNYFRDYSMNKKRFSTLTIYLLLPETTVKALGRPPTLLLTLLLKRTHLITITYLSQL